MSRSWRIAQAVRALIGFGLLLFMLGVLLQRTGLWRLLFGE